MLHRELRVLYDAIHTGAQAVNVWWRPTPRAGGGELERDERAEVVFAEIFSPVTALGVEEELLKVVPVLDGTEYNQYVALNGIRASNMAPAKNHLWGNKLYSFGTPMSNNPLLSTTLKYSQTIAIAALCGPAVAITQNYRVRLWGFIYKTSELERDFGVMNFPAQIVEKARNRVITLNKAPIPVNADTWKTLPGGKDQSIPKINPFVHYARNVFATNGLGGDYQFRFDNGNVLESDENMQWDFDDQDVLIVEGLGVKAPVNLASIGLLIDGDYHPRNLFPTTQFENEMNFGFGFPMWPVGVPVFYSIPKLDKPLVINNEIGTVVARDDTTAACAAGAITMAVTGTRVEMKG